MDFQQQQQQLEALTESTLFVLMHVELGGQGHFNTRTVTAHLITQVAHAPILCGARCILVDSDKPADQMYVYPDGPAIWSEQVVCGFLGQCQKLPSSAFFAPLRPDDPTSAVRVVLTNKVKQESRVVDPGLRTVLDLAVIYGALVPPLSQGGGCGAASWFFRRFDGLRKCFERQWTQGLSAVHGLHM